MQQVDMDAAALLTALREAEDKSPEQLARAIHLAGFGFVAGRTIRNIEKEGTVPTLRVRGSIARYFQRTSRDIWRNAPTFHDRRNHAQVAA